MILEMTPKNPIWLKSKMAAAILTRIWIRVKSYQSQSCDTSNSTYSGTERSNTSLEMISDNQKCLTFKMAANVGTPDFGSLTFNSYILMSIVVIECRFLWPIY